jgi:hypothetical protein
MIKYNLIFFLFCSISPIPKLTLVPIKIHLNMTNNSSNTHPSKVVLTITSAHITPTGVIVLPGTV